MQLLKAGRIDAPRLFNPSDVMMVSDLSALKSELDSTNCVNVFIIIIFFNLD